MIMRTARMRKRRLAVVTVAASAMLMSTVAVAPSASADPYIGPGGEPTIDGISGPWRWMDRPRGEESRDYLPSCAKYYACLYVLSNQTSTRNYWYVFRLYDEKSYRVHNFNYDSKYQWIINNQTGDADVLTFDGGVIGSIIACYQAPASAPDLSRNFKSANWYPVWSLDTTYHDYC
ncbi:hypothetical protein GCM10010402_60630 [Actinomadura luteofluorescens]|nr:hypothetical protein [Actinomadura glauciflava]